MIDRVRDGVKLRFPNADQPDALAVIGNERRIRRGPSESDASYASRLLTWWEDHRERGGPYALLRQMHAYFFDSGNPQIDVIATSGLRHSIDSDGEITRDSISWAASGGWANIWIVFHLPSLIAVTPTYQEIISAVPREWSAAHIQNITIVLIAPDYELWDYPQPVGDWDDPVDAVWNDGASTFLVV